MLTGTKNHAWSESDIFETPLPLGIMRGQFELYPFPSC